jgi:hypothetical protein
VRAEKDDVILNIETLDGGKYRYEYVGGYEVWDIPSLDAREWKGKIKEFKDSVWGGEHKKKQIIALLRSQEITTFDELHAILYRTHRAGVYEIEDDSRIMKMLGTLIEKGEIDGFIDKKARHFICFLVNEYSISLVDEPFQAGISDKVL